MQTGCPPPLARRHPNFGSWGMDIILPRARHAPGSISTQRRHSRALGQEASRTARISLGTEVPALSIILRDNICCQEISPPPPDHLRGTRPTVPRSVPIPQSLADELVSYTQWALQFSSHSRDEIRDTLLATAVERLLNRDYIWQLSKNQNSCPSSAHVRPWHPSSGSAQTWQTAEKRTASPADIFASRHPHTSRDLSP